MSTINPQKTSPEAQADIDDFLGIPAPATKTTTTVTTSTHIQQRHAGNNHTDVAGADAARVNPGFAASSDGTQEPRMSLNYDYADDGGDDQRPFISHQHDTAAAPGNVGISSGRPNSATTVNPAIPPRSAKPHPSTMTAVGGKLPSPNRHQHSLDEITPATAADTAAVGLVSVSTVDDSHQQVHEDEELAKKLQLQLNMAERAATAVRRTGEESETRDNQIHQDEELAKSLWEEERRAIAAAQHQQQQLAGRQQQQQPLRMRPSSGSSADSDASPHHGVAAGGFVEAPQQLVSQCRIDCTLAQAKLTKSYSLLSLSKMDPYAKVRIGHVVLETDTLPGGGLNPRWNKTFSCLVPPGVDSISLEIYDEKKLSSDELIAWANIKIPEPVFNGETLDDWYPLSGKQGDGKEGMIELVLSSRMVQAYPQLSAVRPMGASPQYGGGSVVMQPSSPRWTDEDVKQLHDMFPTVDEEVIKSVMVEKHGNKEEAINALLALST